MINHLHIKNLKSHKDTALSLGNLTLLTGQNGAGKSTIIQALLLLRQTFLLRRLEEGLELKGSLYDIGTMADALYFAPENRNISIQIQDNQQRLEWVFTGAPADDFLSLHKSNSMEEHLKFCALFQVQSFQYISANRSPLDVYPKKDYEVTRNRQISLENGKGELVAHFLQAYGNTPIAVDSLKNANNSSPYLLDQTIAWEREISTNVNIYINPDTQGFRVDYSFDVGNIIGETPQFKSSNVGFGLGYTLPLIVAILAAKPGDLILVENPEAHLHPQGQAKMAELMCRAAQAGIQIIAETHSDHILNGLRIGVKDKKINSELTTAFFFHRNQHEHRTEITQIGFDERGKMYKCENNAKVAQLPKGFFDEWKNSMFKLA